MTKPFLVYLWLIMIMLIGLVFIVQTKFSFSMCILLLVLYTIFMINYYNRSKKNESPKVHSIQQLSKNNRPKWLESFEREAQNILYTMRTERQSLRTQEQYYQNKQFDSPYSLLNSSKKQLSTSLRAIQSSFSPVEVKQHNQFMMNYCNNNFWKRQLKEVFDNFINNLKNRRQTSSFNSTQKDYQQSAQKFGLNKANLRQAQNITEQFLIDRMRKNIDEVQPKINEANSIVSKHFGMTLVNGQTSNPAEISLQQLRKIIQFFRLNKILPQKYYSKYSKQQINADMSKISYLMSAISEIIIYPEQLQPINAVSNILSRQFPSEKIQINKEVINSHKKDSLSSWMIFSDFSVKVSGCINFRTKNCLKLSLLFILSLLNKRMNTSSYVYKQIKNLTKINQIGNK